MAAQAPPRNEGKFLKVTLQMHKIGRNFKIFSPVAPGPELNYKPQLMLLYVIT